MARLGGDCMVQIYRVLYLGRDEIQPSGIIRMNNGYNYEYLYNVPDTNSSIPSIKPGDQLPLTGPSAGAIVCGTGVRIEFDLFNGAYKGKICMDEWEPSYNLDNFSHMESRIFSEDGEGEIVVLYGLFSNAAEARIEVSLFDIDKSIAQVYGVITATTNNMKNTDFSTCLFLSLPSSQGVTVQSPKMIPIPLSRLFVAVPLYTELRVCICLFGDKYMLNNLFSRTLAFQAKTNGTSQVTKQGSKGKFEVKVTWDVNCRNRGESRSECWWNPDKVSDSDMDSDSDKDYDSHEEIPYVGMCDEDQLFCRFRALFADL